MYATNSLIQKLPASALKYTTLPEATNLLVEVENSKHYHTSRDNKTVVQFETCVQI